MELMIVIAILGILVTIIIPSYQLYIKRARYSELVQATTPYKIGVQQCFQITNQLADCKAGENGIPPDVTSSSADLIQSIQVSQLGEITVTPKEKYGINPNDTFILTPEVKRGQLHWHSHGVGVNKGYAN